MEKRRIRLEINGVVCGLITQESEEYMETLAQEVGVMMNDILAASPFVTREAAALTAALSYCDDSKKNGKKAFELQERVDELEVEAELWQEEKEEMLKAPGEAREAADSKLAEKLAFLESENTRLEEAAQAAGELAAKAALLEDENQALRETSLYLQDSELENKLALMEKENERLQEKLSLIEDKDEQQVEGVRELQEENNALRERASEQEELAKKAELEKQGAVSAAKRAVEEARKVVDALEEEVRGYKEEVRRLRERGASPALDLLESSVASGPVRGDAENTSPEKEPETKAYENKPVSGKNPVQKNRKNPLRYGGDFDREGFVSFFEKK